MFVVLPVCSFLRGKPETFCRSDYRWRPSLTGAIVVARFGRRLPKVELTRACGLKATSDVPSSPPALGTDDLELRACDESHQLDRLPVAGLPGILRAPLVLLKFSRPHTLLGSVVSICSLCLMGGFSAVPAAALSTLSFWSRLLVVCAVGIVPSMLMNIYIVGLNQLYDIPVDRVNKPYLPLASGELSVPVAALIVAACLLGSLGLGFWLPQSTTALRVSLIVSGLLGTLYSMPPVRLKRYPFLASLCILVVRGAVVNLGFYLHARTALATSNGLFAVGFSPLIRFATAFFAVYGIVIALMKDIPDLEGDIEYRLDSFSNRYGQRNVFNLCVGLLIATFVAGGFACVSPWLITRPPYKAVAASTAHFIAAAWLLQRSRYARAHVHSREAVYSFYMDVWKCFYLEYLTLPLLL
ncbi:hypoxanthine-guanine phosphoribosyltransferase [Cyanidiococcus yangmingshanensis]|uniref:Hypoxanthine-guanine phosphoribosyltransferase n=1 Tax=Cyanidiococcus yangmingshanensis TaxID=2690220 RepID=A0A7J7IK81_9RHOD|nr:hypoxanthine-guanine phosphoribosyltransferase [Cyanidiococcus yangmingshanensis]